MARKVTPTTRDKGTVSGAKYLFKVKGYPTPLVAKAGGGQTGATLADGDVNYIGTVASGNDSVMLPQSEIGRVITLINRGANTAKVFGNPIESATIDGTAGATGVNLTNSTILILYCVADLTWLSK